MGASYLCYAAWKSKSKMEFANSKRANEFVKPAHHKGWTPFQLSFRQMSIFGPSCFRYMDN